MPSLTSFMTKIEQFCRLKLQTIPASLHNSTWNFYVFFSGNKSDFLPATCYSHRKKLFRYHEGTTAPKGKLRTFQHTDLQEISVTTFGMLLEWSCFFHKASKALQGNLSFYLWVFPKQNDIPLPNWKAVRSGKERKRI